MSELAQQYPNTWALAPMEDLLEINYGKGLPKKERDLSGSVPVYGSSGIVGKHSVSLVDEPCLIVGRKGAVGRVFVSDGPSWPIDTVYFIVPPEEMDIRFAKHLLSSLRLDSLDKSTTIPGISRSDLYNLNIPIPPFPEQIRIVSKLEELFSKLEVAMKSLQRTKAQLERYQQSILTNAFKGKLTKEWRERHRGEVESAPLMVERLLHKENVKSRLIEQQAKRDSLYLYELPETWIWALSRVVCEKIQDGNHFSPRNQYDSPGSGRWLYITAKNIKPEGVDLSNVTYVDEEFHRSIYKRCDPEKGDVLLIKDGVKTGTATINNLEEEFSLLSSVALFKTKKGIMDPYYLKYFLNSPIGFRMITGKMTGTAIKRIILKRLRNFFVPLPPFAEQIAIRTILDHHLSINENTVREALKTIKQSERMRQSILKMALSGKLVPQNPFDEPASKLIERIKEKKENTRKTQEKVKQLRLF